MSRLSQKHNLNRHSCLSANRQRSTELTPKSGGQAGVGWNLPNKITILIREIPDLRSATSGMTLRFRVLRQQFRTDGA
jgi:hypothetical protein